MERIEEIRKELEKIEGELEWIDNKDRWTPFDREQRKKLMTRGIDLERELKALEGDKDD